MTNDNLRLVLRLKSSFRLATPYLLSAGLLVSCGPGPSSTQANKEPEKSKSTADMGSDDDFDNAEGSSSAQKKGAVKDLKPKPSIHGKKTGKLLDGIVLHQQNEFLGPTELKLSKIGARLESSTLTVILTPGQQPVAYNPQNASTMRLTSKSAAIMAGAKQTDNLGQVETKSEKLGTEKIVGLKCIHYYVQKYATDKKTKKKKRVWYADIWETKDLAVAPAVLKECANLLALPAELGFPLRVMRYTDPTEKEKSKGETAKSISRDVIKTSACTHEKIDEGEFAYLEGFKSVKNEMELMMSDTDADTELAGTDTDETEPVR